MGLPIYPGIATPILLFVSLMFVAAGVPLPFVAAFLLIGLAAIFQTKAKELAVWAAGKINWRFETKLGGIEIPMALLAALLGVVSCFLILLALNGSATAMENIKAAIFNLIVASILISAASWRNRWRARKRTGRFTVVK